jgi:hypothetical protein
MNRAKEAVHLRGQGPGLFRLLLRHGFDSARTQGPSLSL